MAPQARLAAQRYRRAHERFDVGPASRGKSDGHRRDLGEPTGE